MSQDVLATMVTTTSYGTWLPGDLRGYVEDKRILPHEPRLLRYSKQLLSRTPVFFDADEQSQLCEALIAAGDEFGYAVTDVSVDTWHLHWICAHGFDAVATMIGRLKNRMRQRLARGRIWTAGYCHRCLFTDADIDIARAYILRHHGCRLVAGRYPRRSRGLTAEIGRARSSLSPRLCRGVAHQRSMTLIPQHQRGMRGSLFSGNCTRRPVCEDW